MAVFVANQKMEKRIGLVRKQDDRKKGLEYVREVREILEALGHRVEGPTYKIRWISPKIEEWMPEETKKKIKPFPKQIHTDYFGVFDLISLKNGEIRFHQVSIIEEKSRKRWDILGSGIPGYFWGRFKDKQKVGYRVSRFYGEEEREVNIYWLREYRKNGSRGKQ